MLPSTCDIIIIGAGAAGLTAAIFAGTMSGPPAKRVIVLESARRPGAKILVSGGGRCNVTNADVSPRDYWGGPQSIVRRVLAEFPESRTRDWFAEMGVPLKLEPDGKYFPVTDSARTVLDALLRRASDTGAGLIPGMRVTHIRPLNGRFEIRATSPDGGHDCWTATRVIVAAGGRALPKSGSDGAIMDLLGALGHTIIPNTPALVPLLLRPGNGLGGRFAEFRGIAIDARLRLNANGKRLHEISGPVLFTHFGLSGPAPMNLSRHWLRQRLDSPDTPLEVVLGLPQFEDSHSAERWIETYALEHPRRHVATMLAAILPERLAQAMTHEAGAEGSEGALSHLSRSTRRDLATLLSAMPLDVIGTRGYSHAEATAGGIDLREVDVRTMESRIIPGLHLCGEILDVDGRIGGFNFQWAWSTGYLAGHGAARDR